MLIDMEMLRSYTLLEDNYDMQTECEQQSGRVSYLCEVYAYLKKVASYKQNEYKKTKAMIAKDFRNNPTKYGFEKITDSSIEDAVILDKTVEASFKEYLKAEEKADIVKGYISAMIDKKYSLNNLKDMMQAGIYAETE